MFPCCGARRTLLIPRSRALLGSVLSCRLMSTCLFVRNSGRDKLLHLQEKGRWHQTTLAQQRTTHGILTCRHQSSSSVSSAEVKKFSEMDRDWWDPAKNPLISMNAVRVQYILDICRQHNLIQKEDDDNDESQQPFQRHRRPLHGLAALDIGCGGGLLSESLARLGCRRVTGIDPSQRLVRQAQQHAAAVLDADAARRLDYHGGITAEEYLERALVQQKEKDGAPKEPDNLDSDDAEKTTSTLYSRSFDIVCLLEVVEHATDVSSLLRTACSLLSDDGGLLFVSTLNRTVKSHLLTILGAEYVMRYLPVGTHNWQQYLSPTELEQQLLSAVTADRTDKDKNDDCRTVLQTLDVSGMVLSRPPLLGQWNWKLDAVDTDVNWIGAYRKTRIPIEKTQP